MTDLAVQIAERLWVPCPDPYCLGGRDAGGPSIFACNTCGGTGKVYPLRKPCSAQDAIQDLRSYPYPTHYTWCGGCEGQGYTPNTSYDVLLSAVRAKGWEWTIATFEEGDCVDVELSEGRLLGSVMDSEGLRGMEANQTAVLRALDKEDEYDTD